MLEDDVSTREYWRRDGKLKRVRNDRNTHNIITIIRLLQTPNGADDRTDITATINIGLLF